MKKQPTTQHKPTTQRKPNMAPFLRGVVCSHCGFSGTGVHGPCQVMPLTPSPSHQLCEAPTNAGSTQTALKLADQRMFFTHRKCFRALSPLCGGSLTPRDSNPGTPMCPAVCPDGRRPALRTGAGPCLTLQQSCDHGSGEGAETSRLPLGRCTDGHRSRALWTRASLSASENRRGFPASKMSTEKCGYRPNTSSLTAWTGQHPPQRCQLVMPPYHMQTGELS